MADSTVRIGLVLPDVMGTYGDGGNATVLRQRLRLRGIAAEIVEITLTDAVPESLDLYTLGGAEDYAQRLATKHLIRHPGLQRAAAQGAPVQSSFTSCRRLKRANTDTGTNTASCMNRRERSTASLGRTDGPPTRAAPAASSPVGVSSTSAAATSRCSEKRGASARRRDVWNANEAQSCSAFQISTGAKAAAAMHTAA